MEEDETGNRGQKAKSSILLVGGVIVLLIVIGALCFVIWRMGHREPVGGNSLGGQAALGEDAAQGDRTPDSGSADGAGGNLNNGQTNESQTGTGTRAGDTAGTGDGTGSGSQTDGTQTGGVGDGQTGTGDGTQTGDGNQTGTTGGVQTGSGGGTDSEVLPGNGGLGESGQNGTGTSADAQNNQNSIAETPGGTAAAEQNQAAVNMTFQQADDTVTAKEKTNLRSEPSTARDDTVVAQLKNGQTVKRTGMNPDTGWSRLEYEGQTLYAVSRFLTTDLTAQSTEVSSPSVVVSSDPNTVITSDGRTVTFTDCDDIVSPKMAVNLRGEPSTAQGNASIHVYLEYRNNVRRTGISEDTGWSRVEYNGEVLYAVTSYLYEPELTEEE